jgi:hypothetical protein
MSLTPGLNLPFGIQPVNPVPVDSWSGPYTGLTEGAALTLANSSIPSAIRFPTMEVRIIVGSTGKKFWYRDGILDGDLVEFASGSGSTGNFLPLSGGTVIGDSYFTQGLSASTFSAGTLYSGSTNLYDIFITGPHTHVQSGLNTYTGGTESNPTVNISAATLSYVSATTFSAGTINSGSTNLYDIFLQIGNSGVTGNFIPMTGTGVSLVTGDIQIDDAVNISWNIGNETFQYNPGSTNIELTTSNGFDLVSGAMLSAGTDLYNIFLTTASTVSIQNGLNTYTGGTALNPTVNISAATLSYVSATTFSAGTINSGSTSLYDIFAPIGFTPNVGSFIPMSGTGLSAVTGDIQIDDAVNISWNIGNETFQYNPGSTNIELTTSNGFDLVSGSMMSAGTDLYNIFLTTAPTASTVSVQNGLNTYTGGTALNPTVNISAATLSYISATTISGATLYSGSTNLYDIFLTIGNSGATGNFIPMTGTGVSLVTGDIQIDDAVNLSWNGSNETLQYNPGSTNIELTTSNGFDLVSGSMMSAGTDLYNIFLTTAPTASTVSIQNGLNTYTGGTPNAPTVNISAATLSYVSATTFSAGTINSGSTNLYDIFLPIGFTPSVGNFIPMSGTGLSAVTGDIQIDDAVNISWNIGNETFQYNPGSTNIELTTSNGFDLVSGSMMSAGTDLYNIFATSSSSDVTRVQNGINTFTGGTGNLPTVNITGGTFNSLNITGGTLSSGGTDLYNIFLTTAPSGSGSTYTNSASTPVTIGGITAGSTFSAQTMQQMWDALLYPYQTPGFTSFSRTNLNSTYELGEMMLSGSQTFTWATSNSSNVSANTITIVQNISPITTLLSNSANDGTEVISVSTEYSAGTSSTVTLYTITAYNSLNSPFSTTISRSWRPRIYYGTSLTTPLVEADIEGLANNPLASGFAGTYSFAAGDYKYFCYPSSFGTATVFKDTATNLNVPMEPVYVVSVTNIYGVTLNYNVHRSTNILGGSINIQIS